MEDTTEQEIKDLAATLELATRERRKATPEQQEGIREASFREFQTLGDPELELILGGFERLCNEMRAGEAPRWLTLIGDSGTGKSMLSEMVHKWAKKNFTVNPGNGPNGIDTYRDIIFVKCKDIIDREKATQWTYTKRICEAFFVVIDDLGAPRDKNEFLADCYARICEERLGKWTIITTNKPLARIAEEIDARIASRMIRGGSEVIEASAMDWNLRENRG